MSTKIRTGPFGELELESIADIGAGSNRITDMIAGVSITMRYSDFPGIPEGTDFAMKQLETRRARARARN